MGTFTHLHLHSQYSLLDGAIRLKDLFPKLHEFGMDSVALTDHGNMFGAIDFYKRARAAGIKPIIGCEAYISDGPMTDKGTRKSYHFVLLAKNLEGYRNLTYLVSKAYIDGFYYTPRMDKDLLRKHSGGLVGLSACLGGEVAQTLETRGRSQTEDKIREYQSIFDPGSYFLEVQPNGLAQQDTLNEELSKLSRKLDIGLVATNDCHYIERRDAVAHDCLMCIQTSKLVSDTNRLKHDVDEFYLKSPAEMEQAFYNLPQAIEGAIKVASMCDLELDLSQCFLPRYQLPHGYDTLEAYLKDISHEGLKRRFKEIEGQGRTLDAKAYADRLEHELGVIAAMGFAGYFLIVWDFIKFAKENGVPVGPGRGSGAGSLVAYALRITDIDPLPYNLLFERFLNPERVSMPDFDIDFCMNRRDEVIHYVTDKYGEDNVGQIVTMHSLKARGVTRDVARAMGLSYGEADRIAKLIPEPIQGKSVSIEEALSQEPRLRELCDEDPKVAEVLDIASSLEGLNRHHGTHAAGVVIGDKPLWEYVPCLRDQNGALVTQYAKTEVEEAGLVKFDFLGLKTLTVLAYALENIRLARGEPLDLTAIAMDDKAVFELFSSGNTTGVFQCESSGFKELLKKLKPDCFEDIIAAVALYRPGPLEGGMVDDFIDRKHGRRKVEYLHPWLQEILEETYGVIVYQEQVMQIASVLAGYSLGQADLLRRAMGKKKPEEMAKQKKVFLAGAEDKKVDLKQAEKIFDLMEAFAGYGFNKSHSAAYGLISYQTAFLKTHYPAEFMAGVLSCEKDNTDNLTKYVAETRAMGIEVFRPDVNESGAFFTVVKHDGKDCIRFGLSAVRNVGGGAVEAIVASRDEQPFTNLFDFCERVDGRRVNRRVSEALIKAGAFDGVAAAHVTPDGATQPLTRSQLMAVLDAAQERAMAAQRDRESGQTSLFGMLSEAADQAGTPIDDHRYPDVPEWEPRQTLAFEKEALGFYVSGHPLDRYLGDLKRHATATTGSLEGGALQSGAGLKNRAEVIIGGMVTEYRERPLRSGNGRMAIFQLEDQEGSVEVVCFSKPFEEFETILKSDEPLCVTARVVFEGEGEGRVPRLQLKEAQTLEDLRKKKTDRMTLRLDADIAQPEQLAELRSILLAHVGDTPTRVTVTIPNRSEVRLVLSERFSVEPTDDLLLKVERLFGERAVSLS
ncbi:MAG: DNA polymerase III subunit alpha [Myxococcales bacterium]|nr:DNA polymerase III subunit alpha [Myxococcales bacterium]